MTLYVIRPPNPPAGTDWLATVPGQYLYNITGITATLNTAVPAVLLSTDTFNRANGPIGSTSGPGTLDPQAWNAREGTWNVIGNQAGASAFTADPITGLGAMMTLDLATPVVDLSVVHVVADVNGAGILCRYVDSSNYVVMLGDNTQCQLIKAVAGAFHPIIGASFGALVAGTVMRLTVDAADLYTVYLNGVAKATATDAFNNAATVHGIRSQGLSQRWDNWQAHAGPGSGPATTSRTVALDITDGHQVVASFPAPFPVVGAGGPLLFSWAPTFSSNQQTPTAAVTSVSTPPLVLPAGYTVGTRTLDLLPTDQWSNITIWWDSNVMDARAGQSAYLFPPPVHLVYHQEPH